MKKIRIDQNIFRAYDIRGAEEAYVKSQIIKPGSLMSKSAHSAIINPDVAYVVGRGVAKLFGPGNVVVGRDARLTSPALSRELIRGLTDGGINVSDLGLATSDLVYFAAGKYKFDMGIMVTGSHTIKYLNGIKICKLTNNTVTPIYCDNGLMDLAEVCKKQQFDPVSKKGKLTDFNCIDSFTESMLSLFPKYAKFPEIKLVLDSGNGMAWSIYGKIIEALPTEIIKLNSDPDGNFPAHDPDPMVDKNMEPLIEVVRKRNADFGVAWDGDADRIAFITAQGEILTGSHMGALLLPWVAKKHPRKAVVVTPPMTKAFFEIAEELYVPVIYAKVGNSHVKKDMDKYNSPFGAEEADHFMFQESYGAESGIIPLLIMLERIMESRKDFDHLLCEAMRGYIVSGDVNFEVHSSQQVLSAIKKYFKKSALEIDSLDGLRVELADWRFCLRPSSIDPVVRLNLECRSKKLMKEKIFEIAEIISKARD
ncbi:MAG: Phosphomannomutase/phosphoglucomutase [bacterium ADurb.Bin212]|nr:MAG: Phosphomannomutase/phosphoglucomutase [bacterium ADurb.Bin212]